MKGKCLYEQKGGKGKFILSIMGIFIQKNGFFIHSMARLLDLCTILISKVKLFNKISNFEKLRKIDGDKIYYCK